jgi:hypothetical protein
MSEMIHEGPAQEDAVKQDLSRTLGKIRRARRFGDLAAGLIQSGRAAALNRQLRRLRRMRRVRLDERRAA